MSFDQFAPSAGSHDEKKYGDLEKASAGGVHLAVADEKYRTYPAGCWRTSQPLIFILRVLTTRSPIIDFDAHDSDGVQRRLQQRHVQM